MPDPPIFRRLPPGASGMDGAPEKRGRLRSYGPKPKSAAPANEDEIESLEEELAREREVEIAQREAEKKEAWIEHDEIPVGAAERSGSRAADSVLDCGGTDPPAPATVRGTYVLKRTRESAEEIHRVYWNEGTPAAEAQFMLSAQRIYQILKQYDLERRPRGGSRRHGPPKVPLAPKIAETGADARVQVPGVTYEEVPAARAADPVPPVPAPSAPQPPASSPSRTLGDSPARVFPPAAVAREPEVVALPRRLRQPEPEPLVHQGTHQVRTQIGHIDMPCPSCAAPLELTLVLKVAGRR